MNARFRYRVAECKDGIQWLLQRQRAQFPPGGAAWDTIAYCRTQKALARLYRTYTGMDVPEWDSLSPFFRRCEKP